MGVKTITIDLEAYATLARHKKPGQSFSQVIKERLGSMHTGADLTQALDRFVITDSLVDALERQVRERRRSRPRVPRL